MLKKGLQVNKSEIHRINGSFKISGELTFATTNQVLAQSRELFAQADGPIEVDLGSVERVDSAGLALLIEWMRTARTQGKEIRFFDLPDQMMAIAAASDLDSILPLSPRKGEPS